MLLLQARVELQVMAMKGYSVFHKILASDCLGSYPGHLLGWDLIPQQRCSQCTLQPQLTGLTYLATVISELECTEGK